MSVRNANFPPQFDATVKFTHRFRYQANTALSTLFSRASLLNFLVEGVSTTSIARLIAAIKINKITIYGMSASNATNPIGTNTISLEWLSDLGTTVIKSDTGNSIEPAKVETGPPLLSRASFWSRSGTNESENLFRIILGAGNIVDFDVSVVLFNDDTPFTIGTTGAVVGQLYQISHNTTLIPVSYPTI